MYSFLILFIQIIHVLSTQTVFCGNTRSGTCLADNQFALPNKNSLAECYLACGQHLQSLVDNSGIDTSGCCSYSSLSKDCTVGWGVNSLVDLESTSYTSGLCGLIDDICVENIAAPGCVTVDYNPSSVSSWTTKSCFEGVDGHFVDSCEDDAQCLGVSVWSGQSCRKITSCDWENNIGGSGVHHIASRNCFQETSAGQAVTVGETVSISGVELTTSVTTDWTQALSVTSGATFSIAFSGTRSAGGAVDVYMGINNQTLSCVTISAQLNALWETVNFASFEASTGMYHVVARAVPSSGCDQTFTTGHELAPISVIAEGQRAVTDDVLLYVYVDPDTDAAHGLGSTYKFLNADTGEQEISSVLPSSAGWSSAISVPSDKCYEFVINDASGNGLCCTDSTGLDEFGFYKLAWKMATGSGKQIVFHQGGKDFGAMESVQFCPQFYDWGGSFGWFAEARIKPKGESTCVVKNGDFSWVDEPISLSSNCPSHNTWTYQADATLQYDDGGTCLHYNDNTGVVNFQQCSTSTEWCTEKVEGQDLTIFHMMDIENFPNKCLSWTDQGGLAVADCDKTANKQQFEVLSLGSTPFVQQNNCPGCLSTACTGQNEQCNGGQCECMTGFERNPSNECVTIPTPQPSRSPTPAPTPSPSPSPTRKPSPSPSPPPTSSPVSAGGGNPEPTTSPTSSPDTSGTGSTETSSPSSSPTTSPEVTTLTPEGVGGAAGESGAANDDEDTPFTSSVGFLVMLGLLLCAMVTIIGLYFHFNRKTMEDQIAAASHEEQDYGPEGLAIDVAALDPDFGPDLLDPNAVIVDTDPGSTTIGATLGDTDPGFLEKIEPYEIEDMPPGTVVRSSVGVGEGMSAEKTDDPTEGINTINPTKGFGNAASSGDLSDDIGLYNSDHAMEGPGRGTETNSQRRHVKDTRTASSALDISDDLYAADGVRSTGDRRRQPDRANDGNLTHPGYQNDMEEFDEGPGRSQGDGNLTHPGFLKKQDDFDEFDEGPGQSHDGNLTHPGFLAKKRNSLDDFDDMYMSNRGAADGNLTHPGYSQQDSTSLDDGPALPESPNPYQADGNLTHPGYLGNNDPGLSLDPLERNRTDTDGYKPDTPLERKKAIE